MKNQTTVFVLLIFLLASCTKNQPANTATDLALIKSQITTLSAFKTAKISSDTVIGDISQFKSAFFTPWHIDKKALNTALQNISGKDTTFLQKYLDDPDYYGANKQTPFPKIKKSNC